MSNLSLVIGNKNYSSWSLRPWLLLKHFEIPFEEIRIALFQEKTRENLTPLSPSLKVPVLIQDELKIWDSLAICEYINESLLEGRAWPQASQARAIARSVSAEMHSGFFGIRNAMPMNCRKQFPDFQITAELKVEIARIEEIWSTCRKNYGTSGDWLFGDFSIADCMFAPIALRFWSYGVQLSEKNRQYTEKLLSLPTVREWVKASEMETEVIAEAEV